MNDLTETGGPAPDEAYFAFDVGNRNAIQGWIPPL